MRTGLHEMHHLARGWTIENNAFGPGIAIAAANEGLAEIYAEAYEGRETAYEPLDADTFRAWAEEIRALPRRANYGHWMFAILTAAKRSAIAPAPSSCGRPWRTRDWALWRSALTARMKSGAWQVLTGFKAMRSAAMADTGFHTRPAWL
ncbi:MAG: hypothetical protein JKP95_00420 [Oceanicaulis sp.]|nr:hypothetical protein [Oceanicaulis sp.]